jgi:hypothetical protein
MLHALSSSNGENNGVLVGVFFEETVGGLCVEPPHAN